MRSVSDAAANLAAEGVDVVGLVPGLVALVRVAEGVGVVALRCSPGPVVDHDLRNVHTPCGNQENCRAEPEGYEISFTWSIFIQI